jgi:hypothetical protein
VEVNRSSRVASRLDGKPGRTGAGQNARESSANLDGHPKSQVWSVGIIARCGFRAPR